MITHVTAAVWKVEIMKNKDINLKHEGATPLIKNIRGTQTAEVCWLQSIFKAAFLTVTYCVCSANMSYSDHNSEL